MKNNRRDFLRISSLAGLSFSGAGLFADYKSGVESRLALPSEQNETDQMVTLNRLPRMVQEYFVERIREVERTSDNKRSALHSRRDAENYIREVRGKIQQCLGPWPEKTPLNARVTGVLERETYNIEKIVYYSRPDFPVTANLYIPKHRNAPSPGILGTCGHSENGKAYPVYQSFAQGLAKMGYVVLIFDPIGQGERIQYLTNEFTSWVGNSTREHNYAGNQMILAGEFLSSWFAWDGIRSLDYLLSRPEVDPEHIGVTGNSGGGTQTTWLCGVEPRITMAAPSCFITTFRRNLENELPSDSEQYVQKAVAFGLDYSDFIAAIAPKPVILLGQEKDFFDVRGLEESFTRLKRLYRLLGAEENIQLSKGPDYHGYSQLNREAMYKWFNSVTKISDRSTEPEIILEKDEDLWCTPQGHVQAEEPKPRTIYSFTNRFSLEFRNKRSHLSGESLKQSVRDTLKMPATEDIPDFRILRPLYNRQYPKKHFCTYLVETEANLTIPVYRLDDNVLKSRPPRGFKRALLYISHLSADNELRNDEFLHDIITGEPDSAVFACDVRGIGESQPNTADKDFFSFRGSDYLYAAFSLMFNYPYVGQKTYDILSILKWLEFYGHQEVHLVGRGWGAIPATFAALLSDLVTQVTLKNALSSYSDIAEHEEYNWPLSSLLPNVLKTFDLPDCYRDLETKNLRLVDPWNEKAR